MKPKMFSAAVAILSVLALGPACADDIARMPVDANVVKKLMRLDASKFQKLSAMPIAMKLKGCTFYEHENGGGARLHKAVGWFAERFDAAQDAYAEYVARVGPWWNDKISSIQCDDSEKVHCSVAVYQDENKGGSNGFFPGSQGLFNLAPYQWNDRISSYTIFCNLMK